MDIERKNIQDQFLVKQVTAMLYIHVSMERKVSPPFDIRE